MLTFVACGLSCCVVMSFWFTMLCLFVMLSELLDCCMCFIVYVVLHTSIRQRSRLFCPSSVGHSSHCVHGMGREDKLPSDGDSSESDAKTLVSNRTSASKAASHRTRPQKKVKKDGKVKAKAKAIDPDKMCTILRCTGKRKAKALYCLNHARDVAAMKYQAEKQGEVVFFR